MLRRLSFFWFAAIVCGAPHRAELRLALHAEPRTFNPLRATEDSEELVRYIEGGTLVRVNRVTDRVEPGLAESWQSGDGSRTLTFHLRPSLRFADGAPLTARDVAETLSAAFDMKDPVPAGDPFRSARGIPRVAVESPRTVIVRFPEPRPDAERLFDAVSITRTIPGKLPVSSGPFYICEYRAGEYVRLARNPWYREHDAAGKQLPYLQSIRLDIESNPDIELQRFRRGDLDLIPKPDPEEFAQITNTRTALRVNAGPSLDSEFLWFNQMPGAVPESKRKWFALPGFRHAVSLAINRSDLARIAYRGAAHPAAGPVSAANTFWFNHQLAALPYDPALAARLLSQAGFRLAGDSLLDSDGHAVEFSVVTNARNRERESMAALIQNDLRKVGIRLNIVTLDFASLIERIMKTHRYEAGLLGFTNVEINPSEQANIWLSSGAMHAWWPSQKHPETPWEARIDELESQTATLARDRRKTAFDEVQKIIVEQEPMIFLVNPDSLAAVSPALHGLQPVAVPPQVLWNIERLHLD